MSNTPNNEPTVPPPSGGGPRNIDTDSEEYRRSAKALLARALEIEQASEDFQQAVAAQVAKNR